MSNIYSLQYPVSYDLLSYLRRRCAMLPDELFQRFDIVSFVQNFSLRGLCPQ
jgi:hypothetical protein